MPGGPGDEAPVAATPERLICRLSKVSPPGCHHSGAMPAVAGPGGTDEVPVQNHAWRLFPVVTALGAATAVRSSPTARSTAGARTRRPITGPPAPRVPHRKP